MGWFFSALNSSIGKKIQMALTGSLLILFLIVHLAGNLTLYGGEEVFNSYVHTLEGVKALVRIAEVILAALFLLHIINGFRLWIENKIARPQKYKINGTSKNTDIFSRTMVQTGSVIFIFLVIHLATFWYSFNFSGHPVDGSYEFYDIVVYFFQKAWYVILYIIAMILLGFHLNHGFQSFFQTFGWNHKKYFPFVQKFGTVFSIVIAVGFASIPIYFFFFHGGN
jgi:succinate dehydrogenase / fumarate reductase cytochrome b subunit